MLFSPCLFLHLISAGLPHFFINLARNAINAVSKNVGNMGYAIADTDYEAAFDFMVMVMVMDRPTERITRHLSKLSLIHASYLV